VKVQEDTNKCRSSIGKGKITGRYHPNLLSTKWCFLQQIGVAFGGKMKVGEN